MPLKKDIKRVAKRILKPNSSNSNQKKQLSPEQVEMKKNLAEVRNEYGSVDREHIWAFIAGQASQDFRGNPKYLFVYINNYRPDIKAYWLCENEETIQQVKALGFKAYNSKSVEAQYVIAKTGVVVAEQVKYSMPEGFQNIKYINLWHGVGFKRIERTLFEGDIAMDIARKYVQRGTFYRDHQLMTVTCPVIEEEYKVDCGVDDDKFLRTGYTRCLYQQNFKPVVSFDHDLRKRKGLSPDAKLVVYAPTYRAKLGGTFTKAFPDFDRLYDYCEKNNILFIFKVHPNMEKEVGFLKAWEKYGDRPHFFFWDNRDDFYEIMHEMDLAIVDYSGIISDMIAMGIKHYIRYIYDYDEYMSTVNIHDNYFEKTTGELCYSFDELILAMDTFEERDESAEIERLNKELWSYSEGKDDFERIIDRVFNFEIKEREFDTLYSFDIFDTLISRKVLDPIGIFYGVKERMMREGGFPFVLTQNYPSIRHTAEFNVREYYNKTKDLRMSEKVEIHFDEIFDRIRQVYPLDDNQLELIKKWELELEYDNSIPLMPQIEKVKELVEAGEEVVLISDMYLPEDFVKSLLRKADPMLATLPLFLSNEYGVLKTSQLLFFEVYKSFKPYYDFKKWIHYGDNNNADQSQPRQFRISTRKIEKPEFNDIQTGLVEKVGTYDAYLVAALQSRLAEEYYFDKDNFVISYVALCFVPYIDWVIRDAERRGYETLYFVSRDGHHLKRIADAIMEKRGLSIKTKYIYGSRRLWRIPSYINEIDNGFWEPYGNFTDLISKEKLFSAMDLTEDTFKELFPFINPDGINFTDKEEINSLVEIFKYSKEYNEYLLKTAAEERVIVDEYLKQEIDKDEKFAVVEYWGRGYNQDCMVRLWQNILGDPEAEIPYYYSRSVLPSMPGSPRHHFTTNNATMYFIEAIFANMPYKSIEKYAYEDGKVVPVKSPIPYDAKLFNSMERVLPVFASKYAELEMTYPEDTDHLVYEFVFDYFKDNKEDPAFAEDLGSLYDSVSLYGRKREFAPAYTKENIEKFRTEELTRGQGIITTNIAMSATRTDEETLREYKELYQILPGDKLDSGRVLTEEEFAENADFRKKYEALIKRSKQMAELYRKAVEKPEEVNGEVVDLGEKGVSDSLDMDSGAESERLILLVANGDVEKNQTLNRVKKALEDKKTSISLNVQNLVIKQISMNRIKSEDDMNELAILLAKADSILVSDPIPAFSDIRFRGGTREILLPVNPFNLYGQALDVQYFLKWKEKYRSTAGRNDFSAMQIPSEESEERYRKNFSHSSNTDCSLKGCCNTDIFFEGKEKEIREKLERVFPESKDKKVILYMPTLRPNEDCLEWAKLLDLESLRDSLGDDYRVVFNYNESQLTKPYMNLDDVPGFSKTIKGEMSIRELLIACDIIVGDYRDGFFESAILKKPVFFTALDYEEIKKAKNVRAFDLKDFIFGPIVRSAQDLAVELKKIDSYDYSKLLEFREKWFSFCDGKSAQRAAEYILGE